MKHLNMVLIEEIWDVDYYRDQMCLNVDNSNLQIGLQVKWVYKPRRDLNLTILIHSLMVF